MSNYHTSDSDNGAGSNGNSSNSYVNKRDFHNGNVTGALPPLSTSGIERSTRSEFEQLLESLHDLFEQDRQVASQSDAARCGICYLYFSVSELRYREEGFYSCTNCEKALGKQHLPMLRKQQKL